MPKVAELAELVVGTEAQDRLTPEPTAFLDLLTGRSRAVREGARQGGRPPPVGLGPGFVSPVSPRALVGKPGVSLPGGEGRGCSGRPAGSQNRPCSQTRGC